MMYVTRRLMSDLVKFHSTQLQARGEGYLMMTLARSERSNKLEWKVLPPNERDNLNLPCLIEEVEREDDISQASASVFVLKKKEPSDYDAALETESEFEMP